MLPDELLRLRLANQLLAGAHTLDAAGVVAHLGAVQAQDYGAALWAVGQRLGPGGTTRQVEDAFAAGAFLRLHVLRPTWHFVGPADVRGLLALTAHRVRAGMRAQERSLGLNEHIRHRAADVFAAALAGGRHRTRAEMLAALRVAGIEVAEPLTLIHLLMSAELDGVICSGPLRGKQQTYALLDERAPSAPPLDPDAALAALTLRYFTSHGPATLRDAAWWSGLTMADIQRGIQLNHGRLVTEIVDGTTYWLAPGGVPAPEHTLLLLASYDELSVAYQDRALYHALARDSLAPFTDLGLVMVFDGRIVGTWKRTLTRTSVTVSVQWLADVPDACHALLPASVQRYGDFLGLRAELAG